VNCPACPVPLSTSFFIFLFQIHKEVKDPPGHPGQSGHRPPTFEPVLTVWCRITPNFQQS